MLQIYYAANAILLPRGFSLASIAILQQTSNNLQRSFTHLLYESKLFASTVNEIRKLYDSLEVQNEIDEGMLPYPNANADGEGMAIEVRYVVY